MKLHLYVRLIPVHALDQYGQTLVQHIYDLLLDIPVKHVIQRIDAHHIVENFLVPLPDLRHRESDNRKTVLLAFDILILDIGYLSRVGNRKLLLFFTQTACRFLVFRHERDLPEALHHRRSAVKGRQFLLPFEDIAHGFYSSLRQRPVQKERHILLMVIVVLFIGVRAAITVFVHTPALKDICSRPAEGRLQTDLVKILHRLSDNPLKSEEIADCHRFFDGDVLVGHLKPDAVALRVSIRHQLYFFRGHPVQMRCRLPFVLRDILPEIIEVAQIRQIALHNDTVGKIPVRVQKCHALFLKLRLVVIAHIPVKALPQLLCVRFPLLLRRADKKLVDLQQKLCLDCQGHAVLLICRRNHGTQFRV